MIGDVCTCGARYDAFRATDDAGRVLSFAAVQAMLRVGSHDPELWLRKDRRAVLRFWGQLKRDQWEVTHGYCASAAPDPEDERAADGDRSFDPSTFDNAAIMPVEVDGCRCDHCTAARAVGAPLPVHRFTYSNRKARPMKTRPSTITLRRTLAAYTTRRDDKRPGPMPCAVEGCTSEGAPHLCPADGERHSHGRIHYTYCHSALTFRGAHQGAQWHLLCPAHFSEVVEALAAWQRRQPIGRLGCTCAHCAAERARRSEDPCAGVSNGMDPCTRDHLRRGVACTPCRLAYVRAEASHA